MKDPCAALLRRIERYLKKSGVKPSTFGRHAGGNSSLIPRIESGTVTVRTLKRVDAWLEQRDA